MAKRKKAEFGRIELPKGKTANERAKDRAATNWVGLHHESPLVRAITTRVKEAAEKQYPMLNDETLAVLDQALSAAEEQLQTLLPRMSPSDIAEAFAAHVNVHLETELIGGKKYGNDVAAFREAVNEGNESAF